MSDCTDSIVPNPTDADDIVGQSVCETIECDGELGVSTGELEVLDENTCVYAVTIKQGDETIETFDAVITSESGECECASEVLSSVKISICSETNSGHVLVELGESTFVHPIGEVSSENEYTAKVEEIS